VNNIVYTKAAAWHAQDTCNWKQALIVWTHVEDLKKLSKILNLKN
jgi:hypothetical protein